MDNQTQSTLQNAFGQNTGYQQPNQVAPIAQPQAQTPILPTPQQAAAATQARMQARTPMSAPKAAPRLVLPRDPTSSPNW